MNKLTRYIPWTLLLLLALPALALAQSAAPYDLSWGAVHGGGYTVSAGDAFELGGTIGQPGATTMTGGVFSVEGGFWNRLTGSPTAVTLASLVANSPNGLALPLLSGVLILTLLTLTLVGLRRPTVNRGDSHF
jgi:hypothetical protein